MHEKESITALRVNDQRHGFRVNKITPLKNLRASAIELEHVRTGAHMLHVHSGDEENLFCIAFRTPPPDDTGLPHILEHSVLCGSKKYPVKHPFIEMVKMSMATFINAMTYSDKTVYPVATNVRQDYYNLAEVYCDAVFNPVLAESTFKQEGHHFEFAKKDDTSSDLIIKGIVYNEMKGAYSGPESVLSRLSSTLLFPDTIYGNDSGGDPEKIPELTFDQFKRFYETYYHPSNAYIFAYGDIPTLDHLAFLEEKLARFERRDVHWPLQRQPRWTQQRTSVQPYPIGKTEASAAKTFILLNWIVGDGSDAFDTMAFTILDLILLGNQAAPLRKAIIDSKLGADLTHSGFGAGRLESVFRVGIKGSEASNQDAFTDLVLNTLKRIVAEGISKESVESAFQQISYRYLEIQSLFPLWLMDRAYAMWIYGADPLNLLRADEHLNEIKRRYAASPGMFAQLINDRLLNNAHRLTLVLVPDAAIQAQKDTDFSEHMKKTKSAMTPEALAQIATEAGQLEKLQATPNTPEAVATLPQLKVTDLPAKPRHIPTTFEALDNGAELLRNDVFANGVNYLEIGVNLAGPPELYQYLPLYGDCVRKLGAAGQSYEKVAERIAAHTGGVNFYSGCTTHVLDAGICVRRGIFSLKWLDGKSDQALAVLKDLLFEVDFSDDARFRDILAQSKAWHQTTIVQRGLGLAMAHASRGLNREAQLNEILSGMPQVRLSQTLGDRYSKDRDEVVGKLAAIRAFMLNPRRFTMSFTGSDSVHQTLRKTLSDWLRAMKSEPIVDQEIELSRIGHPLREGLATPADVAFCAQVIPAPHQSDPVAPLLSVATRLLSLSYMWDEIRIKGGAYGGGCGYSGSQCSWHFYSYRDPSIAKTLATFKGLIDYVNRTEWSKVDIDRAIIGTAKAGGIPIRPGAATVGALWSHILGETPELRERKYAAMLAVTAPKLKQALIDLFEKQFERGAVCVLSSREKLEAANKESAGLQIEDVMT